jgi:hypothetical protein
MRDDLPAIDGSTRHPIVLFSLDRVATATLRQQCLEVQCVLPRDPLLLLAVGVVGRLVQHELVDGYAIGRRVEGEARAGGMAIHRRRPTSLDYESANVFDLALDRVRPGVATVATVVIQHGEMLRQLLCGRTGQCTVAHRAPTTMTGGQSPSQSKAIWVPSLEVTLSMNSLLSSSVGSL